MDTAAMKPQDVHHWSYVNRDHKRLMMVYAYSGLLNPDEQNRLDCYMIAAGQSARRQSTGRKSTGPHGCKGTDHMTEFKLSVNDGPPQIFLSRFSVYQLAVLEAFGKLNLPYPCTVDIWAHILPSETPLRFEIGNFVDAQGRPYGAPAVMTRATWRRAT